MTHENRSMLFRIIGVTLCTAITVMPASSAPAVAVAMVSAPGVDRVDPSPGAPVDALSAGITAFGHELSQVTATPSKNWVASPLSIAYAFAMARAGAGSATAAEIDRAFGFPSSGTDDAFNAATRKLADPQPKGAGTGRPPTLLIGNALFTAAGQQVGKPFLGTLAAHYGAGVYPVDFHSARATQTINEWVRAQTADRIRKLFDHLDPDTRLVLANAVYLRADWEHQFGETPTEPAPFTRADGSTEQVPTMRQDVRLRYAGGDGWQAVELPYTGSDLAMWIMVPSGDKSPDDLLSPSSMASVRASLRPEYLGLALPRWNFGTDIDLADPLQRLGVRQAFDPGAADFSGIQPGLHIDQAVHRANITVDERGTEAAAVTGATMLASAPAPPTLVVRADRPFAFVVVHRSTGLPLFVGHVADPAAHD
jgi:serine protease inhibitor